MVFSSLLFIYIFLPINLLCHAAFSDIKKKNTCLLVFSLIFYAWSAPKYLIVMMSMSLINYVGALIIDKQRGTVYAKVALVCDLVASLGILSYFKYLGFFCTILDSFTNLFDSIPAIVLPVGISFYTFQLISYVVDVYREDIAANHNFGRVLLYTSLYHQCIAGPIVRYSDIAHDLRKRTIDLNGMNDGISRFCVGLAKKTLLANSCASILDKFLPASITQIQNATVLGTWIGGLLYMFQIYLDFSAYSDMAIGLGKMMGFHYKENFRYPYTATSITDFWHKWHISLSGFFRDYVYIPLGGNRKGVGRKFLNMLIVWSLTGLWHGAAYNFVLWGLYYFVFLVIEKIFLLELFHKKGRLGKICGRIYTFFVVFFGWVLFRFSDLGMVGAMIKGLFGLNGNAFTNLETNTLFLNNLFFILICIIAVTPFVKNVAILLKRYIYESNVTIMHLYNVMNIMIPVILLVLSTIALVGNSYNPFIYFRF